MRLFKTLLPGLIISLLTSTPLQAQTNRGATLKQACSYQAVYKLNANNQRLSYSAMKQCESIKTTRLVRA